MKRLFVSLCCLFPVLAFASVGEDLNNLIQRFFGDGQAPVETEIEPVEPTVDPLPDFVLDTDIDLRELRESIMLEEESLASFESDIRAQEARLNQVEQDSASLQNQLYLLDRQIGYNTEKYDQYLELEAKWKQELEDLTREKSEIKALVRQQEREYSRYMSKNFIQKENFETDPSVSILSWLFSSRSVSEILDDRRNQAWEEKEKERTLDQLKAVKKALEDQEKQTALLFDRMSYLARQVARERLVLKNLADLKARLIAQNEADRDQVEIALASARDKQVDSTIYLQALREQLATADQVDVPDEDPVIEEAGTEELSVFDWPLTIPIQIEAVFNDPTYRAQYARDHEGIDLAAEQGTIVVAPADGVVEKVVSNGFGYAYMILQHEEELYTVYGHLSKMLVEKGDQVSYGDPIAETGGQPGTTGAGFFTTGPHLHFEVFHNGKHRDPLNYLPSLDNQ